MKGVKFQLGRYALAFTKAKWLFKIRLFGMVVLVPVA